MTSIADWRYEKPLNRLILEQGLSSALFVWLEPYAVAGHCFLTSGTGCLNCYMNTFGQFYYAVSDFNEGSLKREPGGCTFYQPYGPTALLNIVSMTCSILLKHLLHPIDSHLISWISDKEHFKNVGAKINLEWTDLIEEKGYSRLYERILEYGNCEICSK